MEILIDQAKSREVTELEMIRSQAEELFDLVSTVTKYFYFDPELGMIAEKQYDNYQEVVDDYKALTYAGTPLTMDADTKAPSLLRV